MNMSCSFSTSMKSNCSFSSVLKTNSSFSTVLKTHTYFIPLTPPFGSIFGGGGGMSITGFIANEDFGPPPLSDRFCKKSEKIRIDSEWPETARNRKKKIWKKNFEFFSRFRWFWTTFKKFSKKNFFWGGVTKGQIFFFDFSPFQAILSRFCFFPIFCKIDPIGGWTKSS